MIPGIVSSVARAQSGRLVISLAAGVLCTSIAVANDALDALNACSRTRVADSPVNQLPNADTDKWVLLALISAECGAEVGERALGDVFDHLPPQAIRAMPKIVARLRKAGVQLDNALGQTGVERLRSLRKAHQKTLQSVGVDPFGLFTTTNGTTALFVAARFESQALRKRIDDRVTAFDDANGDANSKFGKKGLRKLARALSLLDDLDADREPGPGSLRDITLALRSEVIERTLQQPDSVTPPDDFVSQFFDTSGEPSATAGGKVPRLLRALKRGFTRYWRALERATRLVEKGFDRLDRADVGDPGGVPLPPPQTAPALPPFFPTNLLPGTYDVVLDDRRLTDAASSVPLDLGTLTLSSTTQFWEDLFAHFEHAKRQYAIVFRDYDYYVRFPERLQPNADRARECPDWAPFAGSGFETEGAVLGVLGCPPEFQGEPLPESFIRLEIRFTKR